MTEVSEKEASQFITIPRQINSGGIQNAEIKSRRMVYNPNRVAGPNAKESNKKIESRQAARSFRHFAIPKQKQEDKPIIPNFNEAERRMKERQADCMSKGPDEILRGPVRIKRENITAKIPCKVVVDDTSKDLASEIADNSMLATPNFDVKKEEAIEIEASQPVEKRIRRRRRVEEVQTQAITNEA